MNDKSAITRKLTASFGPQRHEECIALDASIHNPVANLGSPPIIRRLC